MVCEDVQEPMDQCSKELDKLQCVQISCSVPVMNGRGFIEVISFDLWYLKKADCGKNRLTVNLSRGLENSSLALVCLSRKLARFCFSHFT